MGSLRQITDQARGSPEFPTNPHALRPGQGEYPFQVIKRLFGQVKVRHRALKKNTAQLTTLFARNGAPHSCTVDG